MISDPLLIKKVLEYCKAQQVNFAWVFLAHSTTDGLLMWPWNYFSKRNNKSIDHLTQILLYLRHFFKKEESMYLLSVATNWHKGGTFFLIFTKIFFNISVACNWNYFFFNNITYFFLICLKGIEIVVYHAVAFSALTCGSFRLISGFCANFHAISLCVVHKACTLAQVWV